MTGSGKTTFEILYALNAEGVTCRFFFDDLGRFAKRLRLTPARTARQLEEALQTRWVVFNPHGMFPGKPAEAFGFFCQWVYDVCRRGEGKKLFIVDEAWQHMSAHGVPDKFALVALTGREENIELVCGTQMPHWINAAITGQATELVCFRLDEELALKRVKQLGIDPETARNLPLGQFVALNRLTRGRLSGRVF
jgi:hypothetical protein